MSSLKEVRIRIASVKSTQQITSGMKMVAASKLRRAQNAILGLRPYASKLRELMGNVSGNIQDLESGVYASERKPDKVLLIAIASNKGLCGAFNSNVLKMVNELTTTKYSEQYKQGNVHILTIGKKVSDSLKRRNFIIAGSHNDVFENLNFDKVLPVSQEVMNAFVSKKYDRVDLIYNQFKNAAVQRLIVEQFLPVEPSLPNQNSNFKKDYLFEPSQGEILNDLIPRSLKIQFYKAILDSFASEHGARMTAMHKATDNASELLKDLKLKYNKARQAAITNEIVEIVSGAEALKG